MNATPERDNKRRNITAWRFSRLKRLEVEKRTKRATERQLARIEQLHNMLEKGVAA